MDAVMLILNSLMLKLHFFISARGLPEAALQWSPARHW